MLCCGGSRCTKEQQEEIFTIAAKDMLKLCVQGATSKADQLKIDLPPEVAKVKQMAEALRTATGAAKAHLRSDGVGAAGAVQGRLDKAKSEGGMLANLGFEERTLLGKAAELVDKAAVVMGGAAGVVAEKGLQHIADGLDQAVLGVEEPLSGAGRNIVQWKQAEVLKVYSNTIDTIKLNGPTCLVRGAAPQGPAQFKKCAGNAISESFRSAAAEQLATNLASIALDVTAKHTAKENWDKMIWQYDQANQLLGKHEATKSLQQGPIEVDFDKYVLTQTISQIGELMGKEEIELRGTPADNKALHPDNFSLCFSNDLDGHWSLEKRLPKVCYQSRNK